MFRLTREDNRNAEQEENTSNRKTPLRGFFVDLAVDNGFADKRNSDANGSPEKGLASSDTIDQEDDEDKIYIMLGNLNYAFEI